MPRCTVRGPSGFKGSSAGCDRQEMHLDFDTAAGSLLTLASIGAPETSGLNRSRLQLFGSLDLSFRDEYFSLEALLVEKFLKKRPEMLPRPAVHARNGLLYEQKTQLVCGEACDAQHLFESSGVLQRGPAACDALLFHGLEPRSRSFRPCLFREALAERREQRHVGPIFRGGQPVTKTTGAQRCQHRLVL